MLESIEPHETHLPVAEFSLLDLPGGQEHDLLVTSVCLDLLEQGFHRLARPFQNLQKRPIVVQEHARHIEPTVVVPRSAQQVV
jgi:hypothetical protein